MRDLGGKDSAAFAFLGFLVAIAYQNATTPAGAVLQSKGVTAIDGVMFAGFALVALGTFVSSYLFLQRSPPNGWAWVANLLAMTLQGIILMFMGQVVTAQATRQATAVGYPELALALVVISALWTVGNVIASIAKRDHDHDTHRGFWLTRATALVWLAAITVIVSLPLKTDSDAELFAIAATLCVSAFVDTAVAVGKRWV